MNAGFLGNVAIKLIALGGSLWMLGQVLMGWHGNVLPFVFTTLAPAYCG